MRINVSLDTQIVTLPVALRIKAGSQAPIQIGFLRGSAAATLDEGAQVEIYESRSGYWRLSFEGAWITVRRLQ